MEPPDAPWKGRTFVYTQLTQVGACTVFIQMHAQSAIVLYEVLRLQDAPAPFSMGDAHSLVDALREHVRLMVETKPEDAMSEEGDP